MSNVIYHTFNKSDLANTEVAITSPESPEANYVKIFTHTGKTGEKFLCMKFNAVLKIRKNTKKILKQEKQKTSFELLQEIMDRINEK